MPVKKAKIAKIGKKTAIKKTAETAPVIKAGRYTEAVGRRKTSTARARVFSGRGEIKINDRDLQSYFPTEETRRIVEDPFKKTKLDGSLSASVKVFGGGSHSQAEAVRHALARALVLQDAELKKKLKRVGFLKRDPRMKERRKFGLKKARKAPQWSKR
ncbi:MAG: 30S ribosomal protein S9 [Candidatus Niyogibacteria bacterium]|nr:MAG: 30S ribosomal protein S9 [Candidatus Niyogibacteria bacterium]